MRACLSGNSQAGFIAFEHHANRVGFDSVPILTWGMGWGKMVILYRGPDLEPSSHSFDCHLGKKHRSLDIALLADGCAPAFMRIVIFQVNMGSRQLCNASSPATGEFQEHRHRRSRLAISRSAVRASKRIIPKSSSVMPFLPRFGSFGSFKGSLNFTQ